jgi:hypothetical protein
MQLCLGNVKVMADGDAANRADSQIMPSLFRLLFVVGVIWGIGYGAMFALVSFVNPKPREISVNVPPDRFVKTQH